MKTILYFLVLLGVTLSSLAQSQQQNSCPASFTAFTTIQTTAPLVAVSCQSPSIPPNEFKSFKYCWLEQGIAKLTQGKYTKIYSYAAMIANPNNSDISGAQQAYQNAKSAVFRFDKTACKAAVDYNGYIAYIRLN